MIITITLNPSQDKTLQADGLKLNSVVRSDILKITAGGKGINVSRAVKRLEGDSLALTLLGGATGVGIISLLKNEGIVFHYTPIAGESRTCLSLIDSVKKTETVINENGPSVTQQEQQSFKSMYGLAIGKQDIVVISGSAALGIDNEIFFELIESAHEKGAVAILDASGDFLTAGIKAIPDVLKINKHELQRLAGKPLNSRPKIIEEMKTLSGLGIDRVIITDGGHQALALRGSEIWSVQPPRVEAVSTLGSGDCVSAALARGIERDMPFEETLVEAIAAGTQNALSYGAGFIDKDGVKKLSSLTTIKKL
ncbi:1-phosphofructokinase family hexose kinase [Candidatus Magnetominusculus xianensis]|uniref:1-phosphofructokinase n=1 Tax=Candidatus Magnetominusculus xianensis TaxID=1748249 RepID=A0ABR5SBU7_9BACT|nr:1-phosphofructokinase family hexose kinase [Candidatus Magnetominusculus xianensis]KWT78301.1 1-phosphofructokinase [Candidatus Magnetominusculus xianensis]MBF0404012.1 1-phosphofructokinase family hexose kinase [Nitrospirota bacterium]